ncbi:TetR/AcrR family transcriptional regulator [Deferribacter autotrophicus]|uniref:TetR/AcrR family transcriptional regulator n=1 Tax=Deferribacter autotrophicus TaxID=500465 RepID=A0A5A8F4L6_9BACT|nr:TetR/AcrR family transcriptional regulator [Deferribacter autotrophicus]KAA0258035.1 TetR/AcrR family transcriptional regulator [Deferribacter autotrophicus]
MSQSKKNTKQKIFDAAIKTFAEKGFWKTKVSDIVAEAGVAQGTFYLYFNSKDDCLYELLEYLHKGTLHQINQLIENKQSTIFDICASFIKRIYQYKMLSKVFLFEALSSGEKFKNLYFRFKKNIRDMLSKVLSEETNNYNETTVSIISGFLKELIEYYILFLNEDLDTILKHLYEGLEKIEGARYEKI